MKTLDIRNLKLLYVKLFAIVFLLPSFGVLAPDLLRGVGGGIYAQNPQLFENTWYLYDLVLDGTSNIPPINNEIPYVPADFFEDGTFYTGMCEEGGAGELEYISTTHFLILEMNFLQGGCSQNHPFNQEYSGLYQSFWGLLTEGIEIPYEIFVDGTLRTLIITSPNNDYAVYKNEIPLSINNFSNSGFIIYPNPASDKLFIKSRENIHQVTVYDMQGKLLDIYHFNNNPVEIGVSMLQKGLYFLKIETENGRVATEKFIKQ